MSDKLRIIKLLTGNIIFGMLIFYFAYHAVSGDKGLLNMFQLSQKLEAARQSQQKIAAERELLENKVHNLYSNSLNKDLLDEQVRKTLGKAPANEIMIIYSDKPETSTE